MDVRSAGRSAVVALLIGLVAISPSSAQSTSLRASVSSGAELKSAKNLLREALIGQGYVAVPMKRLGPCGYAIEAAHGERKLSLVVDTGAAGLTLDKVVAEDLRLPDGIVFPADESAHRPERRMTDTAGLRIGEIRCPSFSTMLYDFTGVNAVSKGWGQPPIDGLFSNAQLRHFSAVIDLPSETLFLIEPAKKEWSKLEGRWHCVRFERDGQVLRGEQARSVALIFRDGQLIQFENGEKRAPLDITVNPTAEPKSIDLIVPGRDGKPSSAIEGIYRVEKDRLYWCAVSGREKGKLRPTAFEAKPGSGHVAFEFEPMDARNTVPDVVFSTLRSSGYETITLDRAGSDWGFLVPSRVQDKPLSLLLDTGAYRLVVHTGKAKEFDFGSGEEYSQVTLGGSVRATRHVFNTCRVGRFEIKRVTANVSDMSHFYGEIGDKTSPPFDGLLGTDVLERLSAVIDYSASRLYVLDPEKAKK